MLSISLSLPGELGWRGGGGRGVDHVAVRVPDEGWRGILGRVRSGPRSEFNLLEYVVWLENV